MDITLKPQSALPSARPNPDPNAPRPTPEQRKEAAREISGKLFGRREPTVTPAVAAAVPAPAVERESVERGAAPAAPAAAAPPARPPVTMSDDVVAVVAAARRGTAPAAVPAGQALPEGFEMVGEDKEDYDLICWLAQKNPQKYGTAPAKFIEFLKKVYEYQDKWVAEHKDETFDPEAEEHASFYAANQPPLDRETVERERMRREVLSEIEPEREELKKAREEVDYKRELGARQGQILKNMDACTYRMVEKVNPELAKLLKNGEEIALTKETGQAVDEADPVAFKVLNALDQGELRPLLAVLEESTVPGFKWNPRNPLHAEVLAYRERMEGEILRRPEAERTKAGREFLTHVQYATARRAISEGAGSAQEKQMRLQELNEATWRVTIDDIEEAWTDEVATRAKAIIEEFDEPARRKYKKVTAERGAGVTERVPPPNNPPPEPVPPAAPPVREGRTNQPPPASPGGFDGVPGGRPENPPAETLGQRVTQTLFRR